MLPKQLIGVYAFALKIKKYRSSVQKGLLEFRRYSLLEKNDWIAIGFIKMSIPVWFDVLFLTIFLISNDVWCVDCDCPRVLFPCKYA